MIKQDRRKQDNAGRAGYRRKHRFFAAFLIFCMLVTMPGMTDVFQASAAESAEGDGAGHIIAAFYPLPEEVREQTVPVGTGIEELTLPEELTVSLARKQESSGQEEESGQENEETGQEKPEEGKAEGETAGEDKAEENTEENMEQQEKEEGENTEEGTAGEDNAEQDETEEETTGASDAIEENTGTEDGDGQEALPEENEVPEKAEETEETTGTDGAQETHTVTLPEYYAAHVIPVQTLGNIQSGEQEEPGETQTKEREEQKETQSGEREEQKETQVREQGDTQDEQQEETVTINGVTWQSEPVYDGDTVGTYIFTAILPGGGIRWRRA